MKLRVDMPTSPSAREPVPAAPPGASRTSVLVRAGLAGIEAQNLAAWQALVITVETSAQSSLPSG